MLSVLAFALAVVAPASTITGNYVKDFQHPYVGLLVAYDPATQLDPVSGYSDHRHGIVLAIA